LYTLRLVETGDSRFVTYSLDRSCTLAVADVHFLTFIHMAEYTSVENSNRN
jgi:hypothetical protein